MQKSQQRRTNRGDEKPINAAIGSDRKTRQPLLPHEHIRKTFPKTKYRTDSMLTPKKAVDNKKMEDHHKKQRSTERQAIEINKQAASMNLGDIDTVKEHGKVQKYVFNEDESIVLRQLQYSIDMRNCLLTLYDPKKPNNKRVYLILSSKEISHDLVKEQEAFQLKVKNLDKDVVSDLILKVRSISEKYHWIEEFGIKMHLACELLTTCIKEVENRRFCKGEKKRNETKELKDVDIRILLRSIESLADKRLKLSNNNRWNVSRIEKLIQVLLNETPQPLIPYPLQDLLEKSTSKNTRDYARILKRLSVDGHKMLQTLMEHLENLTRYYANQLNANSNETRKIRRNICARLTPLIIRQKVPREQETSDSNEQSYDDTLMGKFGTMFYKLMETSNLNSAY